MHHKFFLQLHVYTTLQQKWRSAHQILLVTPTNHPEFNSLHKWGQHNECECVQAEYLQLYSKYNSEHMLSEHVQCTDFYSS